MWYRTAGCMVMLTLSLLAAPLAVHAQSAAKMPRLGVLTAGPPYSDAVLAAFRHALHELGWVEAQNLEVVRRYTEGHDERLPALAVELIHLPVDVLMADGTPAVLAAKQATRTIPIIAGGGDLVGLGIVESLARPGSNITGVSFLDVEIAGKPLEFLREALPGITRVAVLTTRNPIEVRMLRTVEEAAPRLGLTLHVVDARSPDDLGGAFTHILQGRAEALHVFAGGLIQSSLSRITAFAAQHRLPVTGNRRYVTAAGGLMSYQPNRSEHWQRLARLTDRILKGAKPADLPVEQPTKFELTINLKTAQALGITMPPSLLLLADEVIQ